MHLGHGKNKYNENYSKIKFSAFWGQKQLSLKLFTNDSDSTLFLNHARICYVFFITSLDDYDDSYW